MATMEAAGSNEFLTFTLGETEYGVDILKVQEIRTYEAPTVIANAPDYILGVVNLRGVIVPVVDMRVGFRLGTAEFNEFTAVIVLNLADRVVGMVVDCVSDVVQLAPDQIRPAPEPHGKGDTQYILGVGTTDDRILLLVDAERLMRGMAAGLPKAPD